MLKNTKTLSDLLKINDQKDVFDEYVLNILKIIKEESKISLQKKDVFVKKNILKIKVNSNTRFVILLYLKNINTSIKNLYPNLTLELWNSLQQP